MEEEDQREGCLGNGGVGQDRERDTREKVDEVGGDGEEDRERKTRGKDACCLCYGGVG